MLVDFKKFEQKMRWREFFYNEDDEEIEWTPEILINNNFLEASPNLNFACLCFLENS